MNLDEEHESHESHELFLSRISELEKYLGTQISLIAQI